MISSPGSDTIHIVDTTSAAGNTGPVRDLEKNTMPPLSVLVADSDRCVTQAIASALSAQQHQIFTSHDGWDAWREADRRLPDAMILDLDLPRLPGPELCRRIRNKPPLRDAVVIMISGSAEEADELISFTSGADDFLSKPFSLRLLISRLEARDRLRHTPQPSSQANILSSNGITIDRATRRVDVDGRVVNFTRLEFDLLWCLLQQTGRAFHRHDLIRLCIGDDVRVTKRVIDVHVCCLRKKLGWRGELIQTVRGVGYRFADQHVSAMQTIACSLSK
jgi:two-component system phosphate regulon response regulator PhoB